MRVNNFFIYLGVKLVVLVFDLDDTIADTDGYSEKYIGEFIKKNNLPYKMVNKIARFAEKKFDWDNSVALAWYKEYGDQMMLEFPCKSNAKEIINKLYEQGHVIVIATARATDWHKDPENITKEWLEKEGLKYHKLYIGRIDKEKICEEVNADLFVDDDVNITQRVASYFKEINKGKSCLFNTLYNKTIDVSDDVIRVNDFNELLDLINMEEL